MMDKKITEMGWRPIDQLKKISRDISELGYYKDFIEKNGLKEKKSPYTSNRMTGVINFFEPIEVKEENGEVFYRENEECHRIDIPENFVTQFGVFRNHNHGEFISWLDRENYSEEKFSEKEREIHSIFRRTDWFVEGNYCDMFDCGNYVYAISNLMHMSLGEFKIVKISSDLSYEEIFSNYFYEDWTCLEYEGRMKDKDGYIVIASGFSRIKQGDQEKDQYLDRTFLIQIEEAGTHNIIREWDFNISSSNSIACLNNFVYFGQNKMVTRIDISSGERTYLTNKTEEEIAAMRKVW